MDKDALLETAQRILENLEEKTNGGGVTLQSLVALGPARYNTVSSALHALGLCGEAEA